MSTAEQSGWQTIPLLCKDCKHCRMPQYYFDGAECRHPQSDTWVRSLVDGAVTVNWASATGWHAFAVNNREVGICGKEGKYFEPKPQKQGVFTRLKRWL